MSSRAVAVVSAAPLAVGTSPRDSYTFYVGMASVCAAIAVLGFLPTYWIPVASGTSGRAPMLHLHGLVFSAWPFLFLTQARLAPTGRFEHHRALGFVGISLVTAMMFAGIGVINMAVERGIAGGFEARARSFAIVPFSLLVAFAGLVGAALANVRRPDAHMRLMLAASTAVLPPAFARILLLLLAPEGTPPIGQGPPPTVVFALLPSACSNLLLIGAMWYDWRRQGRVHPAYLVAGALLAVIQVARIPISTTAAWLQFTHWLEAFGR